MDKKGRGKLTALYGRMIPKDKLLDLVCTPALPVFFHTDS
jgi:hypothetical protein